MLLGFIVLVVAACGSTDEADEEKDDQAGKEAEPITVEHELGTTEVEKNPEKVVVFDFGTLDTLDKLGVDVVGVPQNNIPSYLDKYEGDDYENVESLKEERRVGKECRSRWSQEQRRKTRRGRDEE